MRPQSAPALVSMVKTHLAVLAEISQGWYMVTLIRGDTYAQIIELDNGLAQTGSPWTWAAQSWLAEARAEVWRRQQAV